MAAGDVRLMVDPGLIERLCGYANLGGSDVVLEVGAGSGNLTVMLSKYPGEVIAVEKRDSLYRELSRRLGDASNVTLVLGDVLRIALPKYTKVVSNIPYSISRRLLKKLLLHGFDTAVLTVQKEFAEKLAACPGEENYRMISALTQSSASVEVLEDVSPKAFMPPPNVVSQVVRLRQYSKPTREYAAFLNTLFNHRNKKLANIIPGIGVVYGGRRPWELTPQELTEIFKDY